MKTLIGIVAAGLLLAGCKKEPGEGGKAELRGYVYATDWDDNTGNPTGNAYFLPETRVYLVYGDHEFYDDDTRTGPDGLYKFSWLRKGEYTVFTYSECPTCDSTGYVQVVSQTVEITDKKEVVDVPTLNVQVWD